MKDKKNDFDDPKMKLTPNVSVDCVIFGFDFEQLNILLIERKKNPDFEYNDFYALPGNLILPHESFDSSATRILKELTSLENIFLEQFAAFGDPNRTLKKENDRKWLKTIRKNPDTRVVTIAYYSLVSMEQYEPAASSFAKNAIWIPVSNLPELAFDHNEIVNSALDRLKLKLKTEPIGFELLPEKFTLGQLQSLYESILGYKLDKRNFRRKILKKDVLVKLEEKQKGVAHKSAYLYKFDKKKYEALKVNKFDFEFSI